MTEAVVKNPREIACMAWRIRSKSSAWAKVIETSDEITPNNLVAELREIARIAREIEDAVAEPGNEFAKIVDASADRWLSVKDIAALVGKDERTVRRHAPNFGEKFDGQHRALMSKVVDYWDARTASRIQQRKKERS